MNQCLIDLLTTERRLDRLVRGLPLAFEIVKRESPTRNPSVGLLREHVLIGFFIDEFGRDHVKLADDGVQRSHDVQVCGERLSVKTATGRTPVKVLWTADTSKIERELSRYEPDCDIFLVEIFWGTSCDSIFYIPVEVQRRVRSKLGKKYLHAPVGTNLRGISIAGQAMNLLRDHDDTTRAKVSWTETGLTRVPHDRWVEYWQEYR